MAPQNYESFQAILIFTKRAAPRPKHEWVSDLVHSPTADKVHHKHGQHVSDFEYYIERLTLPGQLVVDPFVGGGTVPEICARTGRRFVGTELNPGIAAAARARVAAAKASAVDVTPPLRMNSRPVPGATDPSAGSRHLRPPGSRRTH